MSPRSLPSERPAFPRKQVRLVVLEVWGRDVEDQSAALNWKADTVN